MFYFFKIWDGILMGNLDTFLSNQKYFFRMLTLNVETKIFKIF